MIRKFAFGNYAIGLSERYVRYSQKLLDDNDREFRFLQCTEKLRGDMILVKLIGMKSRYRSGVGRTVYVLFRLGEIEDTPCNCESGRRTIGGCAHGLALLRLISRQQTGDTSTTYLKSDKQYDSLTTPEFDWEGVESEDDYDYGECSDSEVSDSE